MDQPTTVEQYAARNLTRQINDTAARIDDLADTARVKGE